MKIPFFDANYLNEHCHCKTLDKQKIEYPQYFSEQPHFVSKADLDQIRKFVTAYENALTTPAVASQLLVGRPLPVEKGIFSSYDFHMSAEGPQLIEINTNAAGAVLGLDATRDLVNCCNGAPQFMPIRPFRFDAVQMVSMFRREFSRRFPERELKTVAIVDESPEQQFFYPEFLLTQNLLMRHGIEAIIIPPEKIEIRDTGVYAGDIRLDFIYNRLTDFELKAAQNAAISRAYEEGLATVSPNPAVHALYARKSNLAAFWSSEFDAVANVDQIRRHIPETVIVSAANRDELWKQRKQWFFKPIDGYGGKAVYRGDKLTARVWAEIVASSYIAQKYVPARMRQLKADLSLKYDLRVYNYGDEILGMMARYYQGQTTNFRTENGGLASVMVAA